MVCLQNALRSYKHSGTPKPPAFRSGSSFIDLLHFSNWSRCWIIIWSNQKYDWNYLVLRNPAEASKFSPLETDSFATVLSSDIFLAQNGALKNPKNNNYYLIWGIRQYAIQCSRKLTTSWRFKNIYFFNSLRCSSVNFCKAPKALTLENVNQLNIWKGYLLWIETSKGRIFKS